ncbi:hypothetical protein Tco_0397329 [Tanacetum coccineum]
MDNPDITMEEYLWYETEKALRNGKVYNWETTKYGKINYIEDITYLKIFETKFPAIVYDDALSSEPTLSSQHVDIVNWKNETSLFEYDNEKYNVISERKALKKRSSKKEKFNILSINNDLFSYDIFYVNDLKSNKDNDEDKIGIEQSLGNIFIEPLRNVIRVDVGFNTAYPETWIRYVDYGVALRRYKEQQVQHVDDRVLLEGRWLKLFKVMAAPIISILSYSSKESVGSHAPRVILFGAIPAIIPVIPEVPILSADPIVSLEVGTVLVVSPTGVLDLVDYLSSSDSDPTEDSLPLVPYLPLVSPFLCSDDSESDTEIPERHVSPTTYIPKIPTAPILLAPSAVVAPSSEYLLALVVAPPGIRRRRAILI